MTRAQKIYKALEEMTMCCERIKECEKCGECPMMSDCLDDAPFLDVAYNKSAETIARFIEMAETLTDEYTKDDYEADRGNLERCDPDDM